MEHNENNLDTWSDAVQNAVAEFSRQVGESSQQLAAAAERFASESMRVLDDASRKAETSAAQSTEAAGSAAAAADEVRELSSSIRNALAEAADKVRQETTSFFQDAILQTEQTVRSSREMTTELQEKLESAVRVIEDSVKVSREFAAQATSAAQEARQAANDATTQRGEAASAALEARQAVSQAGSGQGDAGAVAEAAARAAAGEIAALREAVAGAERAAQEAREVALEANAFAHQPPAEAEDQTVSAGAQEVLERLEADYSLLTKLVQELHARIASLSTQTSPVYQFTPPAQRLEADLNVEEASEPSYSEESFTSDETVAEMPSVEEPVTPAAWEESPASAAADSWNATRYAEPETASDPRTEIPAEPQLVADLEPEPVEEQDSAAEVTEAPAASIDPSPTIAGRVLVSISPVPDFDRLLSLDGALGRMTGIGNVTLADYAREEVTFRVEVDPPTSVEDFRSRLSLSAGASIEVVANGGDGLALRLAS